jgi:hypothetical protein
MQNVDIETAKAAKASDRKALAILAFENACRDPEFSNWRGVAELLRLALPASKAKAVAAVETDSRFAPWAEYDIPQSVSNKRLGRSPVIVVTFADGETVRCPAVSLPGKAINIGRGLRIAFAYYRARIAWKAARAYIADGECVDVPELVSISCEATGADYDPADCNARTAAQRAGTFSLGDTVRDATARALPGSSGDGSLTHGDYIAATFKLAASRLRLSRMTDETDARNLALSIEAFELRLTGMSQLQIIAKQSDDAHAKRKAETAKPVPPPSHKPPSRFLNSSHLSLVHTERVPVTPSCVLRVA